MPDHYTVARERIERQLGRIDAAAGTGNLRDVAWGVIRRLLAGEDRQDVSDSIGLPSRAEADPDAMAAQRATALDAGDHIANDLRRLREHDPDGADCLSAYVESHLSPAS